MKNVNVQNINKISNRQNGGFWFCGERDFHFEGGLAH